MMRKQAAISRFAIMLLMVSLCGRIPPAMSAPLPQLAQTVGTPIGPGVGGQVHAFAFDPVDTNVAYAGGDVCGVYKYEYDPNQQTYSWVPWSNGLGFGDLNQAYYVDDLLVLRNLSVHANEGVYAATRGGLYFRHDDNNPWEFLGNFLNSSSTYQGGYTCAAFHWPSDPHCVSQKIPFCSLAFDDSTGKLYAGAGSARMAEDNDSYPNKTKFYPNTTASTSPPGDEYSLWEVDLASASRPIRHVDEHKHGVGYGHARQVAVIHYVDSAQTHQTRVAVAGESKIFLYDPNRTPGSDACLDIWSQDSANVVIGTPPEDYSTYPWGVAAGGKGVLYATMRRDIAGNKHPGVWACDLSASTASWGELGLYSGLWTSADPSVDWHNFLQDAAGNPKRDLTELSVYDDGYGADEVYVGIGRISDPEYGDCGFVRYGAYKPDATSASRSGWAYIHQSIFPQVILADWRRGAIHATTMPSDDVGWHRFYPKLHALVPFAIHPLKRNIMVGIDYGIPMMSRDGGGNWTNLYCKAPNADGGWKGTGLNLLCTRSSTMTAGGRLVIGAADYGVFCATDATNTNFEFLHADHTAYVSSAFPDALDVATVSNNGIDEFYMVDEYLKNRRSAVYKWPGAAGSGDWLDITQSDPSHGLAAAIGAPANLIKITAMELLNPNRIIVAAGRVVDVPNEKAHFYLCEGIRTPDTNTWTWWNRLDLRPGSGLLNAESKLVTDVCQVPGSSICLFSAKEKDGDQGGVYAINYEDCDAGGKWAMPSHWLGGETANSELWEFGRNTTALAVDRDGTVLYVGTARHDSAWTSARGGVLRCSLSGTSAASVPTSWEILSGGNGNWHFPFDYRTDYPPESLGPIDCWKWCTKVTDIAIDPTNPMTCYAAVNNSSYHDSQIGVWRYSGTSWDHVWGGGESGSGAITVEINSTGNKLYIGSVGQEFFEADVSSMPLAAPEITAAAAYPLWSGAGSHIVAVTVTAQGAPVASVTMDKSAFMDASGQPLSGTVALLDDGVEPDFVKGDGIYTSTAFPAVVTSGTQYAPQVTAQGSNGRYTVRNVSVTVKDVVAEPVVADHAAYPIQIGNAGATTVLAITVTPGESPVLKAMANIGDSGGLGGSGYVWLLDDGNGEDTKAGDNVFTSTPFEANVTAQGSCSTAVIPIPLFGPTHPQAVTVAAVAVNAKFANDTAIAGDLTALLTGKPYSSVYFKAKPSDEASEDVMVVTFDDNSEPPRLFGRELLASGVKKFVDRGTGLGSNWLSAPIPVGSRGVCYADYDNDGDTDFFVCNPTHGGKLYRNDLPAGFVDVTAAMFGADAGYLAGAIAASWGDYNGDGFVDLFVATGTYVDSVDDWPALTQSGSSVAGDLRIFKNSKGPALRKSFLWGSGVGSVCLTGCWVDLDNDGDLDLVSTRFVDDGLSVLENHGVNQLHTDQIMVATPWSISTGYVGANSITVIDYDHDDYPDLLVTEASQYHKARILRNNFGESGSRSFTSTDIAAGTAWNGAIAADFNLDGQEDFVLLPKDADVNPAFLVSNGYTTTPVIDEDPMLQSIIGGGAIAPVYRNLGFALGLRDGATGGGFAADLNGDHTYDLFLGRHSADQFMYTNVSTGTTSANWVEVKLRTVGDSNGSLIGTKVVVESASGKRWMKTIDGGSNRGGQSSNNLIFGLGNDAGPDSVRVYYPSGEIDRIGTSVNATVTAIEDGFGAATSGRPSFSYELQPGTADWIFRWKTRGIKGDIRQDKVTIWPFAVSNNPCYDGTSEPMTTLDWANPTVSNVVYKDGAYWQHELRWSASDCLAGCRWNYVMSSAAGPGGLGVSTAPNAVTTPITYCLPGNYGQ